MIYLVNENSGAVWVSGETVGAAVAKVSEIGNREFDYCQVSEFERTNLIGRDGRWYFSVYEADGEFYADDADYLVRQGTSKGYIALFDALAVLDPRVDTYRRFIDDSFQDVPAILFGLSVSGECVDTAEWLDEEGHLVSYDESHLKACHPELDQDQILTVHTLLEQYLAAR